MPADREAIAALLHTDYLPVGAPNRPGEIITPRYVTIHETGNPDVTATARAHRDYLHNKAGGPQLTSYQYVVDDRSMWQLLPHNERANHAGTDPGNTSGIAIELCINVGGDWARTKANAANLVAWLYETVPTLLPIGQGGLVMHSRWRTDTACPVNLRAHGAVQWQEFGQTVKAILAKAPPAFRVGPGVLAAMARARDQPASDERYIHAEDGSDIMSVTAGEAGLYFWHPAKGAVYRVQQS